MGSLYPLYDMSGQSLAVEQAEWRLQRVEQILRLYQQKTDNGERLYTAFRLLARLKEDYPELLIGGRAYFFEVLADHFFRLGDMTKTEQCLRMQASLQQGSADAYLNLGYYYDNLGLKEQAIEVYWEGLRVDPEDQYLVYNLAEAYHDLQEKEKALFILDHAIANSSKPGIIGKIKGDMLLQWGDLKAAAAAYEKALPAISETAINLRMIAMQRLSTCYQRSGNVPLAIKSLEQALGLDARNLVVLEELCQLSCMVKNFQRAIHYGNKALELDPASPRICYLLSICYAQLGANDIARWYGRLASR